jgi:MFS family permease
MRDALGASAATATLAYGAFATAMTTGRFLTDRVAARVGAVLIVRYGSALAAVAVSLIALAPSIPLAIVGWALFGIGLSGTIPQLFSAAGHADPDAAGANVSRVAGVGYVGILSGPAVIGPLTRLIPLKYTFFLPAILCVVASATAHLLRSKRRAGGSAVNPPLPNADASAPATTGMSAGH